MVKRFVLILVLFAQVSAGFDGQLAAQLKGMPTNDQITLLESKLKNKPNDLQLETLLARALLQRLRETMDPVYLQKAASVVDRMQSQDAKNYEALRLQNAIDLQRHNFPKVAERAADLLKRNPSDAGTTGVLGDCRMEMGEYDEAGKLYRHMVELSPDMTSYNRLAYQLFVTGKTQEAVNWMYQAALAGSKSSENDAWVYTEFGDLLYKTGRTADAKEAYLRALKDFPGYHRANAAMGRFLANQGDFTGALVYLKRAQASVPLPDYAALLAAVYDKTGDKKGAADQESLIDAINTLMIANHETMNRNLALIFADENRKLDRALTLAKAEFTVRNDVFTYDAYGWVLYKLKRNSEALEAARKAISLGTPDPTLHYHAGMIAWDSGDRDMARAELKRALDLNPKFDFRFDEQAADVLRQLNP
ncbi:MAG: tetratricopeptide repeat protein [Bryobacteraceae bacterium]